jgi:DNA-binding response OmpR family regulator
VNLPGMTGEQVLQSMKSDARLAEVPVLVLTAVSNVDMVSRMIDAGADDYVLGTDDGRGHPPNGDRPFVRDRL